MTEQIEAIKNTAELFLKTRYPGGKLMYWKGEFVAWDGYWQIKDPLEIAGEIYDFVADIYSKSHNDSIVHALKTRCLAPKALVEDTFVTHTDTSDTCIELIGHTRAHAQVRKYNFVTLSASQVSELLNLEDMKVQAATPNWFSMHYLPFRYDPTATCPQWESFLANLWEDDKESIILLQEWFGYVIAGDTAAEKALCIIGPPRSGKGTIGYVLTKLVGRTCAPTMDTLSRNFGLAPMITSRLAIIGDARFHVKASENSLAVTRLLSIIGRDEIDVDRKHKEAWQGRLPVRFMLLSNETPRFIDASKAIAERFLYLQTLKSFRGMEDTDLKAKLLTELPGIFLWGLRGYQRLRDNGLAFTQPSTGKSIRQELEDMASPVSQFLEEECALDPDSWEFSLSVYERWCQWAEERGYHTGTLDIFARDLRAAADRQLGSDRKMNHATGRQARVITGIKLI